MKTSQFLAISLLTFVFGMSTHVRAAPCALSNLEDGECGLSGSIESRIVDCSNEPDAKLGGFLLVSKASTSGAPDAYERFYRVFKDTNTGLLWGTTLNGSFNHNDAQYACTAARPENGEIGEVDWKLPSSDELRTAASHGIVPYLGLWSIYRSSTSIRQYSKALSHTDLSYDIGLLGSDWHSRDKGLVELFFRSGYDVPYSGICVGEGNPESNPPSSAGGLISAK